MTEGSAPRYRGANGEDEVNAWGIGLLLFAALLMLLGGVFQAFIGLVAIFNDQFLIPARTYLFEFDRTSWGWVHLVLGVVVAGAGAGLLAVPASIPRVGADRHRGEHRRDLGGHDHQPLILTT